AYRARKSQARLCEDVLYFDDRSVAIRQIEQQRCIPIRIEPVITPVKGRNGAEAPAAKATTRSVTPTRNLKIPHGQLLLFTEQLAHLLAAGMTLDEGLSILEKRLKQPRVQQMTQGLHQGLVDGRSFSQ